MKVRGKIAQCLLALVCSFAVLSAGCTVNAGAIFTPFTDLFEQDRQLSWEYFKEERPEPIYIRTKNRPLNKACAEITDVYVMTMKVLDKTIDRVDNSEIVNKLETVRIEQGEEAYFDALSNLDKKDRASYNKYIKSEINYLKVFVKLERTFFKVKDSLPQIREEMRRHMPSGDILEQIVKTQELILEVQALANVLDQFRYGMKAVNWIITYNAMLERAQNYKGQ